MRIIGLTGSIATGKSTVAQMMKRKATPVFDADACVHRLLQPASQCFSILRAAFPEALDAKGQICRRKLGALVFANPAALSQLESILHPKVRALELAFIAQRRREGRRCVVLEIPLLYETGADALCSEVWVTWCPAFLQEQRMLRRASMTQEKYRQILARQWPQAIKCARADVLIPTGLGKGETMRAVLQALYGSCALSC